MNTKQALKKCFEYFLDPEHKAGSRDGSCVYYANGGNPTMCAIGCLLPKRYRVRAGKVVGGVETLFNNVPAIKKFFSGTNLKVLCDMQALHDNWALGVTQRDDFLNNLQNLMGYQETVT